MMARAGPDEQLEELQTAIQQNEQLIGVLTAANRYLRTTIADLDKGNADQRERVLQAMVVFARSLPWHMWDE